MLRGARVAPSRAFGRRRLPGVPARAAWLGGGGGAAAARERRGRGKGADGRVKI